MWKIPLNFRIPLASAKTVGRMARACSICTKTLMAIRLRTAADVDGKVRSLFGPSPQHRNLIKMRSF